MLNKLLKYDLKWVFKPLVIFYILLLVFSFILRIVESFKSTLILLIIDKLCCGIVISLIISILINWFMRNWARFIKNIYKDESYLTHTLPVSKNNIFLAKVLTSLITLFTSIFVIVISLAISTLNSDTWIILKETLESSATYFNTSVFSFLFIMISIIFFELLFIMLSGIVGIIKGQNCYNLKMLKSVVYGFIIYGLLSILVLAILYLVGLVSPDFMNIFNNTLVTSETSKCLMIIILVIYGIYNILLYLFGLKLLNKGVNVD